MQKPRRYALLFPSILALLSSAIGADQRQHSKPTDEATAYSYATSGVLDERRPGEIWKILLDESNLGGKELELAELTLKAGTTVDAHTHQSLEVIYVLSGTFGHEVNGHYYLLKPGMVGVVRPGDHVRHLVPKDHDARVLLIWAPAGEAKRIIDYATGTPIKAPSESERPQ
jgi:quercetin dioxygenase-like cupin family protein